MEAIKKALANCEQNLSSAEQAQCRSNIGAQAARTAGPNVDIINDVVSTEKVVVEPGTNVTITSSSDSETRTITYNISASGSTYNVFTTTEDGLAPKSGANTDKFLKGDGTWATPTDTTYNVFNTTTDGLAPKANGTGVGSNSFRLEISNRV